MTVPKRKTTGRRAWRTKDELGGGGGLPFRLRKWRERSMRMRAGTAGWTGIIMRATWIANGVYVVLRQIQHIWRLTPSNTTLPKHIEPANTLLRHPLSSRAAIVHHGITTHCKSAKGRVKH